MMYIKKLPYFLAALMSFIIGITCLLNKLNARETYIKMFLGGFIFLIIGYICKLFLESLVLSIDEKSRKILEMKKEIEKNAKKNKNDLNEELKGLNIDFRIDDSALAKTFDEEFEPLKVSEIIRAKVNE